MNLDDLISISKEISKNEKMLDDMETTISKLSNADSNIVFSKIIETDDLINILHEKQTEIELQSKSNYNKNIYALDIATNCIRQTLFSYFGLKELQVKVTYKSSFFRDYGIFIQEHLEKLISFTGTRIRLKKELVKDIFVVGELDCFYITSNNDFVIIDIKTVDSDTVQMSHFNGRTADIKQVFYYSYLIMSKILGDENVIVDLNKQALDKIDINKIHSQLWYVSRDFNVKVTTYKYLSTSLLFKDSIEYYRSKEEELSKFILEQKIPAINHKFTEKNKCFFCVYKKYCFNNPSQINNIQKDLFLRFDKCNKEQL